MSGTASAGTSLSREVLNEVLGEQPGTSPPGTAQSAASFASRIQEAIDQGADLDWIRRHFYLSDSELRDYCSDIMDDDFDENRPDSASGY